MVSMKLSRLFSFPGVSTGIVLFCFFFAIYALTIYGGIRYGDEWQRYLEVQSLIERQSLAIQLIPANVQVGIGGHNYSQFEMGMSVALTPLYAFGRAVSNVVPTDDRDRLPTLFANLLNPLVTALACVVLYKFNRALGVRESTAIFAALILGLGTIVWHYGKGFYREVLQGFLLLLAAYAVYEFRWTGDRRFFALSALSLGYLVFTKVANAIVLPLFAVYLLSALWKNPVLASLTAWRRWVGILVRVSLFFLPTLVFLGIQGVVNLNKFGSPLTIGPFNYQPSYFTIWAIPAALESFFLSPERSVFVYALPTILFLPAWVLFPRKDRLSAIFILLLIVAPLLVVGAWSSWWDQSYWGPKYVVALVPLMILPLGLLWEFLCDRKQRLGQFAFAALGLIGLFVQVVAAGSNDREFFDVTQRWIDLSGAFDFIVHGAMDSLAFSLSPQDGWLHINAYGWLSLALVMLFGLALMARLRERTSIGQISRWRGFAAPAIAVSLQIIGLIVWIAIPYATVLAEKGNTRYVAANTFAAENRFCEARGLYLAALALGTDHASLAASQIEKIAPGAQGVEIVIDSLTHASDPSKVRVEEEPKGMFTDNGSVTIAVPSDEEYAAESTSDFFDVLPNTPYELSGWLEAEGVYGSGFAVMGWYEDNGKWRRTRYIEIATAKGPHGLQPFRQVITTLPATQRALVKAGFWQAYGKIRVEGIRLIQVQTLPEAQFKLPCAR